MTTKNNSTSKKKNHTFEIRKHHLTKPKNPIETAKQFIALHRPSSVVNSNSMNLRKPVSHLSFNCCCTASPGRVVTQNKVSFNSCNANTLGRQISLESPNSGLTKFVYDKAGNMIHRITPNLRAENSAVTYKNAAEYEKDDDDEKPRSALFFYHPDHTTFVSDAQGREYEHIEYTPYGETWLNTRRGNDDDHDDDEWDWDDDEGSPIRRRFTGKEIDPETGLQYFGARYQDPRTSRWISSDPAGPELMSPMETDGQDGMKEKQDYSIVDATNWYSYSSNRPITHIDPTGLDDIALGLSFD